ncbi:class I SAM-dependent methyltransferase [Luteolibacter sp. AS25]|uniref:class I SAM-dependent methyltransferase n=1 Tax=Luteolibacter sp. AS25 TaxID=3135776 RepID=UPI00398BBA69
MNPALETLVFALRETPLQPGRTLFLGAQYHPDLPESLGYQPLKPLAEACLSAGMELTDQPAGKFTNIIFLPGKSKEETLAGYALAHDLLIPGGTFITALSNTSGASRFEKELRRATPIIASVSKNKCRAFTASNTEAWNEDILRSWQEIAQPSPISGTDFITRPGVFSASRIDPGSELLAKFLPPSLHGQVADLGAGWGYLSRIALEKSPKISAIHLFEADSRSLSCARENLPTGKAAFHWHDVTTGLPEKYDHIITNPPFHSAQSKDLDLGKAFISTAVSSLKRGGSLYLVANRQLPYEAHLSSLGLRSRPIFEDHAYKIIFSS